MTVFLTSLTNENVLLILFNCEIDLVTISKTESGTNFKDAVNLTKLTIQQLSEMLRFLVYLDFSDY